MDAVDEVKVFFIESPNDFMDSGRMFHAIVVKITPRSVSRKSPFLFIRMEPSFDSNCVKAKLIRQKKSPPSIRVTKNVGSVKENPSIVLTTN
jgi:hypothetical protein